MSKKKKKDAHDIIHLDPIMTGAADYANAVDRAMTAIYAGKDPKSGLDDAAKEWDSITQRLGKDRIKASYQQFLKLPGATSKNTIEWSITFDDATIRPEDQAVLDRFADVIEEYYPDVAITAEGVTDSSGNLVQVPNGTQSRSRRRW